MSNLTVKQLKVTATKIVLVSYLGCAILGFFHVLQMSLMSMPLDDCPFSRILKAVSNDAVSSHLQILNLPIVTVLLLLELGLFSLVVLLLLPSFSTDKILEKLLYTYRRRNRLRYSLYISLFSNGILNPKAF